MDRTSYAVTAHDLVKTYPKSRSTRNQVKALDGLSLGVRPGEIFGLLGPNGAGKTTTVKVLSTLARPDAGEATVAGHDALRHPRRVRQVIGVASQRSGADPAMSGRANLLLQGRLYGMTGTRLRQAVAELLDRFHLADAADRKVRTYSGGMQRRLDVALALLHRPQVLFLDEPTTGLDPEARAALWTEIAALASGGLTILLTTHYLEEADRLADRLAIVDRGRVVATGTPDELKGELRGDAVRVALDDSQATALAQATIANLPGVREVALDGRHLSARTDDGAAMVPQVLAALDRAGVAVASVTVARPSLDDVYLRHAGRRLSTEPADAGALASVGGDAR